MKTRNILLELAKKNSKKAQENKKKKKATILFDVLLVVVLIIAIFFLGKAIKPTFEEYLEWLNSPLVCLDPGHGGKQQGACQKLTYVVMSTSPGLICDASQPSPRIKTVMIGPIDASATNPKVSDSLVASFLSIESPTPSDMIKGTVIAPVVTPPESKATPKNSLGTKHARPNVIT